MTREEASTVLMMLKERELNALENIRKYPFSQRTLTIAKALDMAVEALSNYKLKGKNADIVVIDASGRQNGSIVQCKDCRNTIIRPDGEIYCTELDREEMEQDFYCKYGERRNE